MKIRINFFAEPSQADAEPSLIACPTGDFASLEEARPIALADGNKPAIMAHSIIIGSLDDASLSEQWIRDRDGWKSTDA
jgi:hypothetical protein